MRTRIYVRLPDGTLTVGWQDLGEGHAATGHHRGELVVGQTGDGHTREAARRVEPPPCAVVMPLAKKLCARPIGHKDDHMGLDAYLSKLKRRSAA